MIKSNRPLPVRYGAHYVNHDKTTVFKVEKTAAAKDGYPPIIRVSLYDFPKMSGFWCSEETHQLTQGADLLILEKQYSMRLSLSMLAQLRRIHSIFIDIPY